MHNTNRHSHKNNIINNNNNNQPTNQRTREHAGLMRCPFSQFLFTFTAAHLLVPNDNIEKNK